MRVRVVDRPLALGKITITSPLDSPKGSLKLSARQSQGTHLSKVKVRTTVDRFSPWWIQHTGVSFTFPSKRLGCQEVGVDDEEATDFRVVLSLHGNQF